MQGYPNANLANGHEWTRIPPFVIPNGVRNLTMKRKEILRFALNDKLMVNGQWLIVMRGTRYPNAEEHPPPPLQRGKKRLARTGHKG